jgi:rhodanese-related sulfurtransferase
MEEPLEQEPFRKLETEEAEQLIKQGYKVIDVRDHWEYEQGHIPGAINVPLMSFLTNPYSVINDSDIGYIFVCSVGERSAVAAEMACAVGAKNVANLVGGTDAWKAKGKPIEK